MPYTPTASGNDVTLKAGESIALWKLFDYSDRDGDIVAFAVREVADGYLTRNGVRIPHGELQDNIHIDDISNWRFVAGSDTGTVRFNAIDSRGAYNTSAVATVTVEKAPEPSDPTASPVATYLLDEGDSIALSDLFTYSDADGDIVAFAVREIADGYLTRNGVRIPHGELQDDIPIGDIGNWRFVVGSDTGTVRFNAIDSRGAFNPSAEATVNVRQAPEPEPSDPTASPVATYLLDEGDSIALSDLFTYSDADGDIVAFAVREIADGYLTRNGVRIPHGELQDDIPIGDIGNWRFVAGSDTGTVRFNAIDSRGAFNPSAEATVNVRQAPEPEPSDPDAISNDLTYWVTQMFDAEGAFVEEWMEQTSLEISKTDPSGAKIAKALVNNLVSGPLKSIGFIFEGSEMQAAIHEARERDGFYGELKQLTVEVLNLAMEAYFTGKAAASAKAGWWSIITVPAATVMANVIYDRDFEQGVKDTVGRLFDTTLGPIIVDQYPDLFPAQTGSTTPKIYTDVAGNQTYEGSADADTFTFRAQDTGHDAVVIDGPDTIQLQGDGWVVIEGWNGMAAAATGADRSVSTNIAWTNAEDAAALFNLPTTNGGSTSTVHNDVAGNQTYEGSTDADTFTFRAQDTGHDAVVIDGPDTIQLQGDGWVVIESWNGMAAAATGADRSVSTNIAWTNAEDAADLFGLF